jgi:hypothetical protein
MVKISMKVSLSISSNMEVESKNLQTQIVTKGYINWAKLKVMANIIGLMVPYTKGTLSTG